MFEKFSVGWLMDDRKKKAKELSDLREKRRYSNFTLRNNDALSDEVTVAMLNFGYSFEQLITAHRIYRFESVDHAISIMMKDPETGEIHHAFLPIITYSSQCKLCNYRKEEHKEEEPDTQKNEKKSDYDAESGQVLYGSNDKTEKIELKMKKNVDNDKAKKQLVNKPIEFPKEVLDQFEDPDLCYICCANKVDESTAENSDCKHVFCTECLTNHITSNINNGRVLGIRCLSGGCPKYYRDVEIKRYVDDKTYYKFKKFFNRQVKLQNPDNLYIFCPFTNCEEMIDVTFLDNRINMVECNSGHPFCIRCKKSHEHSREDCKDIDIDLINAQMNDEDRFKQCPECMVILERDEKENRMLCINCHHDFCWLCMKPYTNDHFANYNVAGCPGMQYRSKEIKDILKDKFHKCCWYFGACLLAAISVVGIVIFYLVLGCAYELVKCYIKEKRRKERESEDSMYNEENNNSHDQQNYNENENPATHAYINGTMKKEEEVKDESEFTGNEWAIIITIGFCGFLLQPLYLLFYVLYGIMECYRRFNCWFYYAG